MFVNADALFNVLVLFNVVVVLAALAFVYVILCLLGRVLPAPEGGRGRMSRMFYVAAGFLALVGALSAVALLP